MGKQLGVLSKLWIFKAGPIRKKPPRRGFFCANCKEEYELKSQKKKFGTKIVDGAFRSMNQRLASQNNPNLLLLNYDLSSLAVTNLMVIPKHFFVSEIIEERKLLAHTARRAGWIGCNILLDQIPTAGKISIVRDGRLQPKDSVLSQWRRTLFLREQGINSRGWLIEVMKCIEATSKSEFSLDEMSHMKVT
jgi:type II restriction enzyme